MYVSQKSPEVKLDLRVTLLNLCLYESNKNNALELTILLLRLISYLLVLHNKDTKIHLKEIKHTRIN